MPIFEIIHNGKNKKVETSREKFNAILKFEYEKKTGIRIEDKNNDWTICPYCFRSHYLRDKPIRYNCGPECKKEQRQNKMNLLNPSIPNTRLRGAISELRAAADLMNRGFEVFRAESPLASCDLIILKDKIMKRVEVKSTRYSGPKKQMQYPQGIKDSKHDILVFVFSDKIKYKPLLKEIWKGD